MYIVQWALVRRHYYDMPIFIAPHHRVERYSAELPSRGPRPPHSDAEPRGWDRSTDPVSDACGIPNNANIQKYCIQINAYSLATIDLAEAMPGNYNNNRRGGSSHLTAITEPIIPGMMLDAC
jgi:hypothetical protein